MPGSDINMYGMYTKDIIKEGGCLSNSGVEISYVNIVFRVFWMTGSDINMHGMYTLYFLHKISIFMKYQVIFYANFEFFVTHGFVLILNRFEDNANLLFLLLQTSWTFIHISQ